MRQHSVLSLSILLAGTLVISGCGALLNIILPRTVTARFVNNGNFPVELTIYYSDVQEIPRLLLTQIGDRVDLNIPAGESRTLTRDCDDLQAIVVADADLRVIGAIGPSTSTGVLRDGSDFSCGSTITFTFNHSSVLVDFNVTISVSEPGS